MSIIASMHMGYLGKSSIVASKEEDWVTDIRKRRAGDTWLTLPPLFHSVTFTTAPSFLKTDALSICLTQWRMLQAKTH